jgi:2-iminobutanoate/2-iminopropanoate deaminase
LRSRSKNAIWSPDIRNTKTTAVVCRCSCRSGGALEQWRGVRQSVVESSVMKHRSIFTRGVVYSAMLLVASGCTMNPRSFQVKKQIIRTSDAPNQSPLYSQAVKAGSTIYVTGILGIDPKTNQPVGTTIQEQTRQALVNCRNILRAAGADLENVVEVQVLLARPNDFAGLNEEYAKFFPTDPPARTVARLGPELPNLLVSIRMTAVL